MLRTNKEWYNLLSPTDKVLFNQNLKSNDTLRIYLSQPRKRPKFDFIHQAFIWMRTPQGHDYWSKISNSKD